MTSEKYITLMHKEIDGEITAEEKTALDAYLAGHPQAREVFEQIQLASRHLSGVESVDVPVGLKAQILDNIDPKRYAKVRTKQSRIINWKEMTFNQKVLPLLAAAAGLIVGIVLYPLTGLSPDKNRDMLHEISGTMGVYPSDREQTVFSTAFESEQLKGNIELGRTGESVVLHLNYGATDFVETRVNYHPGVLSFLAVRPQGASEISIHQDQNNILVNANRPLILVFKRNSTETCDLNISLISEGKNIKRLTIPVE